MNRYLEKIASMTVGDATSYMDTEYRKLVDKHNIEHREVHGIFDKDYWEAVRSGGHFMKWSVGKYDSAKISPKYSVLSSDAGVVTRLRSPIYKLWQTKKDRDLIGSLSRLHEAIEVDEFNNSVLPILKQHLGEGGKPSVDRKLKVGDHINPAVVMRESNLLSQIGRHGAFDKLFAYRKAYDDPILLKITGKRYGDTFTQEDMDKARSYFDKPLP